MTVRQFGKRIFGGIPFLEGAARVVYQALPRVLQDTPAGRLERHFGRRPNIIFVQIGAFDGVESDPLHDLISSRKNWHGILVEPQAEAFSRLQENYKACADRLTFMNCAIGDGSDGNRPLYFVSQVTKKTHNIPDWADMLVSFNRKHLEDHFPGVPISEVSVEVLSLAEVAKRNKLAKIDAVIIDAEGAEPEIITAIDFDGLGIECLVYEHIHLTETKDQELQKLLHGHGFEIEKLDMDIFAKRSLLEPAASD